MHEQDSTTRLQDLVRALQAGGSRDVLFEHSPERCRQLARQMFRRHPDLRALDDTDDVLQKAMLRLHRALDHVRPETVAAFFGLAARQIRWVLKDLARERARAASVYSPGAAQLPEEQQPRDPGDEPSTLLEWSQFHDAIDRLPVDDRQMFDLLLYQSVTQPEAAELLGVSLRTAKRRWQKARLALDALLQGAWPGCD